MADPKSNEAKKRFMPEMRFDVKTVLAICMAVAGVTGWVQQSVSNYRLVNITDRLSTHEQFIRANMTVNADQNTAIQLNGAELIHIKESLSDLNEGMRALLSE
tara:strand:+ start:445 stop:753 length:309 start_codon:yes stop_codon:yes gene_type:complete